MPCSCHKQPTFAMFMPCSCREQPTFAMFMPQTTNLGHTGFHLAVRMDICRARNQTLAMYDPLCRRQNRHLPRARPNFATHNQTLPHTTKLCHTQPPFAVHTTGLGHIHGRTWAYMSWITGHDARISDIRTWYVSAGGTMSRHRQCLEPWSKCHKSWYNLD
jgi:hypothetical protein